MRLRDRAEETRSQTQHQPRPGVGVWVRERRVLMTQRRGAPGDGGLQGAARADDDVALVTAVPSEQRVLMTRGLATAVPWERPRCEAAWTRPPPLTASPRKCPSMGKRTTSSS